MKTPLVLAFTVIALSTSAHASWYQTWCSNPAGTTKTANGHNYNFVQLTKRSYMDRGPVETIIRDEKRELYAEQVGESVTVVSEQKSGCRKPGEVGFWSSHNVVAAKYKIVHRDGKLFDKDIVGVSSDLKSVEVEMICQNDMNSQIMCPKE